MSDEISSYAETQKRRLNGEWNEHNHSPNRDRIFGRQLGADEIAAMNNIKGLAVGFFDAVEKLGASRELSVAKTKIEEAIMWATKHIALPKNDG